MKLTVADVLAKFLKEASIEYVFGVAGHPLFAITDALYREPGIDLVPSQMEVTGAYMANGYAVAGRRSSACIASAGPGVTNLVTGAAEAFKESTPLFVLGADVENRVAHKGASSWHELPQAEIMAPITKLSRTLRDPAQVFETLQEAHRAALSGRAGPVYLGFPPGVQATEIDVPDRPWLAAMPPVPSADPSAIEQAAAELAQAKAPLIIAGGGVYWANAGKQVGQIAEALNAPVGTSHTAKGVLSEEQAHAIGSLGFGAYPFADGCAQEADVILAVGTTFSEAMTRGYGHRVIPEGARIIQIDLDPAEIGKSYPVQVSIVGDALQALTALQDALRQRPQQHGAERQARMERIRREKAEWFAELARRGSTTEGPITHAHIVHAVQQVVQKDAVLIAAGCTGEIVSHAIATAPVYESGDFRAIGHGLASGIGIKLAVPERQVITMTGDGSFMMELSELATARRTGLPLVVLVVNNSAYGGMKRDQIRNYGGRIIGTELCLPKFQQLAESFGIFGRRVERPAELEPALQAAMGAGGPALIDVVCPVQGI